MEVRDKREEGRSLNPPFHIPFYLFITNLIGLKYPTFLFYVWTEDIFLFGALPVFLLERHLKVVYQHV